MKILYSDKSYSAKEIHASVTKEEAKAYKLHGLG